MDIQAQVDSILADTDHGAFKAFSKVMTAGNKEHVIELHSKVGTRIQKAINNASSIKPIVIWVSEDMNRRVNLYPIGNGMACVKLADTSAHSIGFGIGDFDNAINISDVHEWLSKNVQNPQNTL